jgi:predicted butyrate kinase (DUF1464 family)
MKTKLRLIAPLLVLGALGAVLLAGCGGGSSTSSGGGGAFVSGAEAACTKANKQIAALGTPAPEEVTEYVVETEAVIETLQKEVAALEASGAAETAYVEGLTEAVPILTKMSNAARNENLDAVRELSSGLIEIRLGELAEAAKLKTCAEIPVSES